MVIRAMIGVSKMKALHQKVIMLLVADKQLDRRMLWQVMIALMVQPALVGLGTLAIHPR